MLTEAETLVESAIKQFFLSFFSNSLAEKSRQQSIWPGFLAFFLGLFLFFCGLMEEILFRFLRCIKEPKISVILCTMRLKMR